MEGAALGGDHDPGASIAGGKAVRAPGVQALEIEFRTPIEVFAPFAGEAGALLLDSVAASNLTTPGSAIAGPTFVRGAQRTQTAAPGPSQGVPPGLLPLGDRFTHEPPPPRVPDARYSYIALEPLHWLTGWGSRLELDGRSLPGGDPFAALEQLLGRWHRPARPDLPPFQGGAAGYLAYDLLHHLEAVRAPRDPRRRAPDLAIGLYDLIVAFDLVLGRSWVLCGGLPFTDPPAAARQGERRIAQLLRRLEGARTVAVQARAVDGRAVASAIPVASGPGKVAAANAPARRSSAHHEADRPPTVFGDFERPAFERNVARVVEHIHAGDIFQANLAQRFRVARPAGDDDFELYLRLRNTSPAPFAAYLRAGPVTIASASPERFLAVRDDGVEARPIKGTRPRGAEPDADRALALELLASPKDRSENVMIVDLLRNDLSRACRDGTVQATQLCGLESFAGVHHLVSTVVGRLKPGAGVVDLLRAAFPCGSVTGAPRVRAMEIIHQLEPLRRGPYCGAIGWWGLDGAMDSNVAIRTIVLDADAASIHAGGGIVADSDPSAEYEETLVKAAALVAAARGEPAPGAGQSEAAMAAWLAEGRNERPVFGLAESRLPEYDPTDALDASGPSPGFARGVIVRPDSGPSQERSRGRGDPTVDPSTALRPLVLLIDNYDSFVDNLARYVGELGWSREVVRNDAISVDEVAALAPACVILSPGPDGPSEAGICLELVRRLGDRLPILGICLGHQVIGAALGARVVRAGRPVHGRSSIIHHDGRGAFTGLPDPLTVARYHSLIVEEAGLPPELEITARTASGTIMGLRHRRLPIVGLQFHPESVRSEGGHRMLANVLGSPGAPR